MKLEAVLLTVLGALRCATYRVAFAQAPVKARAFCLEGYILDAANSLCVKNLKQSFTLTCPQHCEFDANGTCACVEEVTSETACPPGFTLDASQKNCTTVVEAPATSTCEQSSQKLINNVCTGVIVLSPEFTCPPPAYVKGDLCVHEEISAPSEECPPGFELTPSHADTTLAMPARGGRALQMSNVEPRRPTLAEAPVEDLAVDAASASTTPRPGQKQTGQSTTEAAAHRATTAHALPVPQEVQSSPTRTLAPPQWTGISRMPHKHGERPKGASGIRASARVVAPTLASRGSGGSGRLADIAEKAASNIASRRALQARGGGVGGGRLFSAGRGSRKAVEEDDSGTFFDRHEFDRKKGFSIHGVGLGERGGGGFRGAGGGGGHLTLGGNLTAAGTATGGFDGYAANNGELVQQPPQQQTHMLGGMTTQVCLSKTAVPARPSCPPNHRLEKDACVSEIVEVVNMACEEGFHYDSATLNCVRETMQPPVPECPDGYRVEGRQCVFTQVEEPQRTCRDGFIYSLEENMCIKILKEPPRFKCASSEYYFDGRSCEKTLTLPPTLSCAAGRLLSDACLVIETSTGSPSCNPGAALDHTQLKCLSSSVAPVKYTCAQGELSENRTCVNHTTAKARVVCPENFEMKGDTCTKEKTFQPVQSCPPNSQLLGSDCLLHTEEAPVYTCAAGFELHRDTCIMAKRVAPTQTCAAGYTPYKEKCIRQTRRSGQITCPESFVYDGTQCVIHDQQRPIYVCPEGHSLEEYHGDSCVPDSLGAASMGNESAGAVDTAFSSPGSVSAVGIRTSVYPEERRKVGLQVMALGRRKPQLLSASF